MPAKAGIHVLRRFGEQDWLAATSASDPPSLAERELRNGFQPAEARRA
jgi:hypothetical protein